MTLDELKEFSFEHPIILYDGICILCEDFLQKIISADYNEVLRFASLQGSGIQNLNTVLLIDDGNVYYKSDVLLRLNELIDFDYHSWVKYLPRGLRDFSYTIVANNRYNWFGKKETCQIPGHFPKHLFLDGDHL